MKCIYVVFSCLLSLTFFSCKNKNINVITNPRLENIEIVYEDKYFDQEHKLFSEIIKIDLETSKNCLIGNIRDLKVIDSDLYIIQNTSGINSLLRFNQDGRFLNEIGKYGRGPGEFLDIRDFNVDNNIIEVLSNTDILQYTIEGNFIKNVFKTSYPGVGFFKQKSNYFVFHSVMKPYMLTKYSPEGEMEKQYYPNNYIDAVSENDKVVLFDNEVSLFCSVRDTIYTINNDEIAPKVIINFLNMPSASIAYMKANNAMEFITELNSNEKNYCTINNYLENSNYIIIKYSRARKSFYCIYDKEHKKSIYFDSQTIDKTTEVRYSNPIYLTNDDYLVIPVLKEKLTSLNNPETKSDSESDTYKNPEIWFCKINLQSK
ncbi:MAG TPA: 6-bladed beta-propeller [Candidatus Cloacimonadota bacterium]|nr:6-bladed beta-propeller [Candidatus Cloacimonadota bacterium]